MGKKRDKVECWKYGKKRKIRKWKKYKLKVEVMKEKRKMVCAKF